jgi:hypothetical protein
VTKRSLAVLLALATFASLLAQCSPSPSSAGPRFEVVLDQGVLPGPIAGRVFIAISRHATPEPRELAGELATSIPFFGVDVQQFKAGNRAVIDGATAGYPTPTLKDVPPGDYYVQAILSVYTQYHRADGHVIWAHQDQWEGQEFGLSPGNPVSTVARIRFDPQRDTTYIVHLTRVLPPIVLPPDTAWVKHVKIRSALLTKFWGVPQYLGATLLLPKGYAVDTQRHYPAVYVQGQFFALSAVRVQSCAQAADCARECAACEIRHAREPIYVYARVDER